MPLHAIGYYTLQRDPCFVSFTGGCLGQQPARVISGDSREIIERSEVEQDIPTHRLATAILAGGSARHSAGGVRNSNIQWQI